jgi:hypothetical protein
MESDPVSQPLPDEPAPLDAAVRRPLTGRALPGASRVAESAVTTFDDATPHEGQNLASSDITASQFRQVTAGFYVLPRWPSLVFAHRPLL